MPTREFRLLIHAPLEAVWEFHNSIQSLFLLTPPSTQAKLDGDPVPMAQGVVYKLKLKRWGVIPLPTWSARIAVYDPPHRFEDEQISGQGPFKSWRHVHRFERVEDDYTLLFDQVTYEVPFGVLGKVADSLFIRADIERMFAYRHQVTKRELEK